MFGAKRKARKIKVSDETDETDEPTTAPAAGPEEPMNDAPPAILPSTVKFTRRPVKSSSLRKSINIDDNSDILADEPSVQSDDDARPAVVRPMGSRFGSTKIKKKGSSSRLSFGVTEDTIDTSDSTSFSTPKKNSATANLAQRATENSAVRGSMTSRQLPTRSFGAESERPAYSREYLEELQSSTPITPAKVDALSIHDDDAMPLDASELEGAVFVPSGDATISTSGNSLPGHILTATEIREKKERRARLAKEGDAYASDASDNDDGYISLVPKKKKDDTRLIAEDEDLGEGYDEFVEDGRLELGKRGETEAKRRHRREMAELINLAEGASEDDDSDSDAERKAAYEAAQTRSAMDGLRGVVADENSGTAAGVGQLVIPKMKPLPELEGSLDRLRELLQVMEERVTAKRKRIEAVEREKQETLDREAEVQEVLNQAGMKYQAVMGIQSEGPLNPEALAAHSPLRNPTGVGAGERGLESFGTPTRVAGGDGDGETMET